MTTVREVAKKAAVSIGTVSKVLNGKHGGQNFTPETIERIRKIADKLGYRPYFHAQALRKGSALSIGIIFPAHARIEGFWSHTVAGVADQVRLTEYDFLVIGPSKGRDEVSQGLEYLRRGRVDALVMGGFLSAVNTEKWIHDLNERIVLVEYYGATKLPVIGSDKTPGIRQAVQHLIQLGHREILWAGCGNPSKKIAVPERFEAFQNTIRNTGARATEAWMDDGLSYPSDHPAAFIASCKKWFAKHIRDHGAPSSIICYNEHMGLGIYAALAEAGLRVPDDVSVVGFDDIFAELAIPPMSVVSLMLNQVGRRAAEIAISLANCTETPESLRGMKEWIPSDFVIRQSTAPSRQNNGD